ncbi:MAG: Ppx/GppA family phosphatase [Actinobacteria bacterium]|nr:Ppx/GppA family phosphatase [Actinomycetota bacterium]MCB9389634.1 Ppx/GppA family phosphatase [Acidimicrobiia bacterium]
MSRYAAIDMGSNSTRLLIVRADPDVADADSTSNPLAPGFQVGGPDGPMPVRLTTLERHMRITRLGAGVDGQHRLADDAIARTVEALAFYRTIIDAVGGVDSIRATATSAARDASNATELLDRSEAVLGVRPEVISGEEEARLSFAGATADLPPGKYLVADIGGGSTELVWGEDRPEGAVSLDVGCVRMTERYLASDPPAPEELANAVGEVKDLFLEVAAAHPEVADGRRLIGLAGTVSTAAAIELGQQDYDREQIHHFTLTKAAAEDVFRTLATEPLASRLHNPGLAPQRADVIVGGMCVLVNLYRVFGFVELTVSESDILDGTVADLAAGGPAGRS